MIKILAPIYGIVGFIMAILDSLDIIKLASLTFQANLCALNGNINCVNDVTSKMIIFAVDVILWPFLLAADLAKYGQVGAFIGVLIILFFYKMKK